MAFVFALNGEELAKFGHGEAPWPGSRRADGCEDGEPAFHDLWEDDSDSDTPIAIAPCSLSSNGRKKSMDTMSTMSRCSTVFPEDSDGIFRARSSTRGSLASPQPSDVGKKGSQWLQTPTCASLNDILVNKEALDNVDDAESSPGSCAATSPKEDGLSPVRVFSHRRTRSVHCESSFTPGATDADVRSPVSQDLESAGGWTWEQLDSLRESATSDANDDDVDDAASTFSAESSMDDCVAPVRVFTHRRSRSVHSAPSFLLDTSATAAVLASVNEDVASALGLPQRQPDLLTELVQSKSPASDLTEDDVKDAESTFSTRSAESCMDDCVAPVRVFTHRRSRSVHSAPSFLLDTCATSPIPASVNEDVASVIGLPQRQLDSLGELVQIKSPASDLTEYDVKDAESTFSTRSGESCMDDCVAPVRVFTHRRSRSVHSAPSFLLDTSATAAVLASVNKDVASTIGLPPRQPDASGELIQSKTAADDQNDGAGTSAACGAESWADDCPAPVRVFTHRRTRSVHGLSSLESNTSAAATVATVAQSLESKDGLAFSRRSTRSVLLAATMSTGDADDSASGLVGCAAESSKDDAPAPVRVFTHRRTRSVHHGVPSVAADASIAHGVESKGALAQDECNSETKVTCDSVDDAASALGAELAAICEDACLAPVGRFTHRRTRSFHGMTFANKDNCQSP